MGKERRKRGKERQIMEIDTDGTTLDMNALVERIHEATENAGPGWPLSGSIPRPTMTMTIV